MQRETEECGTEKEKLLNGAMNEKHLPAGSDLCNVIIPRHMGVKVYVVVLLSMVVVVEVVVV